VGCNLIINIICQTSNSYHILPYSSASQVLHTGLDSMTGTELNNTEKTPYCSLRWHPVEHDIVKTVSTYS